MSDLEEELLMVMFLGRLASDHLQLSYLEKVIRNQKCTLQHGVQPIQIKLRITLTIKTTL